MFIKDGIAYAGELSRGLRVESVKVLPDLCMLVTFNTGETRLFDVTTMFEVPVFQVLGNVDSFNSAKVEHGVVCWLDGEIDLAPEAMYKKSFAYEQTA